MRGRAAIYKTTIAILLAAATLVSPASALGPRRGVVTAMNTSSQTFNCEWRGKSWTYLTGAKTVFVIGKTRGNFSDLKLGAIVTVNYHLIGKQQVADRVVVSAAETKVPDAR